MKIKIFIIILITGIIIWLLIPILKFNYYRDHYEYIGSYYINLEDYDRYTEDLNDDYIILELEKSDYQDNDIEITDILYYDYFSQISFGFISNVETDMFKYNIKVLDENDNFLGKLITSGAHYFYNKSIEEVICILDKKLASGINYRVIITDKKDMVLGDVSFFYNS
ncbi:hypothetical protein KHQ82_07285 [Mycoplasmatota bacterium]|nr:hypothetical protein KHQ82_07285 [Mycoplasmatota bacterium]